MAIVFETERLIARHWEPERDVEDAFAIYGDLEVMRFLGRDPQVVASRDEMRERLQKVVGIYAERNNGTGAWALEEKATGNVVGAILVKHLPDANNVPTGDMEVGWHLARSKWGNGYATEAARAGVLYGFDVLQVPAIYAVIYADNTRSIAVAERLGMAPKGPTDKYYGVTLELFELLNDRM